MHPMVTREEAFAPFVPPLTIELTSRCNLKCPYCANPTLEREYGEMPIETVYRLADECVREGYQVMAVHGIGEPLLRKDLEAILSHFTQLGIWSGWIATNGTLLTTRRMEALVAAGLKGLYVSMDTLDADLYARTRGGKLTRVISNVQSAAHLFPTVTFVVGLMNHKEQTVDERVLEDFRGHFQGLGNVTAQPYENFNFPGAAEDWSLHGKERVDDCDGWSHHFTIDIAGRVAVCCADQQSEHILGDVNKQTIREIWFSEKNQNTFRSITLGLRDAPEVCRKCALKPSTRRLEDVDPLLAAPYSRTSEEQRKRRNYWGAN